jgi:hypothetical protein
MVTGTCIIVALYVACLVCCVGSDLCDRLIVYPEECYRVCVCVCVFVCDLETVNKVP